MVLPCKKVAQGKQLHQLYHCKFGKFLALPLVQFAKFLWGEAKHLFELAVAIGDVCKTNVGGNVAKGFVGDKQKPSNLTKLVANGVVDAGCSNKLFEQLHEIKLAVTTLVGKLANNKLMFL